MAAMEWQVCQQWEQGSSQQRAAPHFRWAACYGAACMCTQPADSAKDSTCLMGRSNNMAVRMPEPLHSADTLSDSFLPTNKEAAETDTACAGA